MFSALRTRYGIPGVIATVALVFAMTGGAFAAKYLITSTKQIKPSVLKKLKGATGPAGAQGAAGAAGAKGDTGAQGPEGKKGAQGEKGVQGDSGDPWTAGGTLPPGATETGVWAFGATIPGLSGPTEVRVPISFAIPLAAPLASTGCFSIPVAATCQVHYINSAGLEVANNAGETTTSTACLGSLESPTAASGHLCVYTKQLINATMSNQRFPNPGGAGIGAARTGAYMNVAVEKDGEEKTLEGKGAGTWAVTG